MLALSALSVSASTLPFLETFDELTNNASIQNQNGWVLASGTSATIQSGVVATNSTQALEIQNSQVTHDLSSDGSSIWIRFQARIIAAPEADPVITNTNTSVAFFVNTNRNLVVYNSTNPVVLNTQLSTNEWCQFDVYCDYANMKWILSVNGTTVASNLSLYSANSQIASLQIANNSANAVYLDELAVQDTEPASGLTDTDGDGLPDWWEQRYTDSITSAATNEIAANGQSFLYNYVAGLDPDNSSDVLSAVRENGRRFSWERKAARQYDIYWTSNLTSGFSFIDTADGYEFEDTNTVRTAEAAAFYQIRVHK